ncbi:response regulator, partial [Leisingera sp. ANG-DT]
AQLQAQGPFDGAVIDMSMPGRGGWETLARLLQVQPGLNAVMMSGFAFSAAEAGFPELNGVQVLDKPFTKEKLYKALFR